MKNMLIASSVVTLGFLVFMLIITGLVVTTPAYSPNDWTGAALKVASWTGFSAPGDRFDTSASFGALAVFGAIVIGLILYLGRDTVADLPAQNQAIVRTIMDAVFVLISLYSAVIMWNLLARRAELDALLVLALAGILILLTSLISLERGPREKLDEAEKHWKEYRSSVEPKGVTLASVFDRREVLRAKIKVSSVFIGAALLVPLFAWIESRNLSHQFEATALATFGALSAVMMLIGWLKVAHFPPHTFWESSTFWLLQLFGAVFLLGNVVAAFLIQSWLYCVSASLITTMALSFFLSSKVSEHLSAARLIRRAASYDYLKKLHNALVEAQENCKAELASSSEIIDAVERRRSLSRLKILPKLCFRSRHKHRG